MGTSTDGQICFGVMFEEDYEFPWSDRDDGIEDWWLEESGWKYDGENPFDADGNFAPGFKEDDPRVDAYFDSQSSWKKSHPCPVVEINYQSGDYPAYILAIPDSLQTANRGNPVAINPEELSVDGSAIEALKEVCAKYDLKYEGEPSWYLSSYWG